MCIYKTICTIDVGKAMNGPPSTTPLGPVYSSKTGDDRGPWQVTTRTA